MRIRGIVQRPGRKQHFGSIAPGDAAWLTLCDREVSVFGATVTAPGWLAQIDTARTDAGTMCRRCRTALLLAGLAVDEIAQIRAEEIARALRLRDAVLDDRLPEILAEVNR